MNCDYIAKFYTKCTIYYTRETLKDFCYPINYMTCFSPFSVLPEHENFNELSLFDYTRVMVMITQGLWLGKKNWVYSSLFNVLSSRCSLGPNSEKSCSSTGALIGATVN